MNELIAKLENLGAFHIFFTLSMVDMRWPEIVTSILFQQGKNIVYSSDCGGSTISSITIDGEQYQDFVKRENIHDLNKDNVLTGTRCFDQRVKAFIEKHCTRQNQFNVY